MVYNKYCYTSVVVIVVALKKPSEYFKKENAIIDNAVENVAIQSKNSDSYQLSTFSDAYESFRNNLSKIDSFSESLNEYNSNVDRVNNLSEKIDEIQTEIKNFLSKEDLDRALISQLLVVEQSIRDIQGKVKGINENNLKDIRSDVASLTESVNKFLEVEVPKYKKISDSVEKRFTTRYEELEESVNQSLDGIETFVSTKYQELTETLQGINEDSLKSIIQDFKNLDKTVLKLQEKEIPKYKKFIVDTELKTENKIEEFNAVFEETVNSLLQKINSVDGDKANLIKVVNDKIQEVSTLRDLVLDDLEQSETSKENFIKKINDLEVEVIRNESHLKVQNKNLEQIQEDVRSAIQKLNLEELEEKNYELGKKVKYLEEVFEKFNEKEILTESIVAELPSTNNEDPLTPLDQNFVTLDQLQNHYRLFINRIQQQLATIGGGGETQLKYLDDIVGIATNPSAYDNKFLKYNHSLGKFEFDIVPEQEIDISEQNVIYVAKDGNDANAGTLSRPKLTIKNAVETLVSVGVTDRVVRVAPGTYIENNPIVLPDEISVVGQSLRETTVIPQNDNQDLFHIGNANYIAEMSFRGSLPGKAIFAFDPTNQRYISQSPYIQNCTNFIPDSIGMRIDGKDSIGPLKSMVLDSYTQYNQGGIGVSITNEAYAQLVSLFTICDDIAVYCGSGGACDLTNSNSSFGNYGLVADGVSGKKYTGIATVASSANSDTFVVDLSVPTLNVVGADYNNETGRIKVVTDQPHKFNVGMAVTLAGLGFTCDFEPGIREYPSGANGYVFNVETVAPGRYLDAANLIQANKAEIQDKSLASIALNHPDFIFPGDPADDARYRFYDSYRLIQKNKQEIVDKSLASIAVGFPSGFYFPGEEETNPQSRFYDASRLITINKQEIVDKSLAAVAIAHSDFYFPGDTQTTIRSRYYDSYRLIQRNRSVIVDSAWTELSTTYPDFTYSQTKCKRDIGFFIDAVSTDVFTGGNNYSREFVLQYFNGNVNIGIAASEVAPSVYAFQQARDLMKSAITNTLVGAAYSDLTITADPATGSNTDPLSCANVRDNIDTLSGIVTTSIGAGNTSSLPLTPNLGYFDLSVGIGTTVSPGGVKCARDLGFLIEAVATDVFTGGNKYARDFTLQYFDNAGNPITNGLLGETNESITAFNALRDYSKKAITNQLNRKNIGISSGPAVYGGVGTSIPVLPSGNPDSCTDVQDAINTLVGIVTTVIGSGTTAFLSTFNQNLGISTTNKCARDLGFLVDAVATDVFTGGNKYVRDFSRQYFDANGEPITNGLFEEEPESVYAFNTLGEYAKKAITNQLNYKEVGISSGPAVYGGAGGNIPVLPSGNPDSCTDVQNNIDTLVGIVTSVIGSGSLSIINNADNLGTFTDVGSVCRRDIGYIVDAVTEDLIGYTNSNIIDATKKYFTYSGVLDVSIENEIPQSITAFESARDYMKLALNNQLNSKDLTILAGVSSIGQGGPIIPIEESGSPTACADVRSTVDTLVGIITTNLGNRNLNSIPNVSLASTIFTVDVGIATQPHYYNSGGQVKTNVIRPFDGQSIYFNELFYTVKRLVVVDGGSGYTTLPTITIQEPDTPWGIKAQAVPIIENGVLVGVDMISNGRGYRIAPRVTISSGINTAVVTAEIVPEYYTIQKSTEITNGISIITTNENIAFDVGIGTEVKFFKQSRVLATGHSFEFIGAGTDIANALPFNGGTPPNPDNETDARNGGLVVYSSTNQAGNFKIGDGVIINQNTGNISGQAYSKSLISTMTPYILSLGGF